MQRSPTTVLDKAPPATPPKGAAGMVLMGGSAGRAVWVGRGCMAVDLSLDMPTDRDVPDPAV